MINKIGWTVTLDAFSSEEEKGTEVIIGGSPGLRFYCYSDHMGLEFISLRLASTLLAPQGKLEWARLKKRKGRNFTQTLYWLWQMFQIKSIFSIYLLSVMKRWLKRMFFPSLFTWRNLFNFTRNYSIWVSCFNETFIKVALLQMSLKITLAFFFLSIKKTRMVS